MKVTFAQIDHSLIIICGVFTIAFVTKIVFLSRNPFRRELLQETLLAAIGFGISTISFCTVPIYHVATILGVPTSNPNMAVAFINGLSVIAFLFFSASVVCWFLRRRKKVTIEEPFFTSDKDIWPPAPKSQ